MSISDNVAVPKKSVRVNLDDPVQTKTGVVDFVTIRAPLAKDMVRHFSGLKIKDLSEMELGDTWELAKDCSEDQPRAVLDLVSFRDMTKVAMAVVSFLSDGEAGSPPSG